MADDNDWIIHHESALSTVFWLTSWIRSGLIHITLSDLLALEESYEGILGDIDKIIWQIELIKAQTKDARG